MLEWWQVLSFGIGILFLLFLTGIPIFLAFLAINIVGVTYFMGPSGFGMFANSIFDTTTKASLATIALFILMGEVLFRSGAINVVLTSVDTLVGKWRGRQYVLSVALSTVLGALSGTAMGISAMLARTLFPTMVGRGYSAKLAAGTMMSGASLSPIIPPSVLIIIIGTLANTSIARLLVAGIVPGLLLAGLFILYIMVRVRLDPSLAPNQEKHEAAAYSLRDRLIAIGRLSPFLVIMFFVIGFIVLGVATPSEAAATGVAGALITAAYYRSLTFSMAWNSLKSAAGITAMVLIIMASSAMFSQLLSLTGATADLTRWVADLALSPAVMLLVMLVMPFLLCMFVDQIALLMVIIPIYQPILSAFDFDPVWFWTLMLLNVTVGGITPPFGYTIFAFKGGVGDTMSIGSIFNAAWPFVWLFVLAMVLIAIFPGLATFLPAQI